jgi:GNAT superfamily N-acetyltransferase
VSGTGPPDSPVAVREADEGDLDEVLAMIGELAAFEELADQVVCTIDDLRSAIVGKDAFVRVSLATVAAGPGAGTAPGEAPIAGMALWFPTFSTFLGRPGIWLEDLFVRPPYRRQGVARILLEHLRARTAGRVEWDVLDWNERAIALYRSMGARPVEGWTRYRWLDRS